MYFDTVSLNPGNLRPGMAANAHGMLCIVDTPPRPTNHPRDPETGEQRTFATDTWVSNRADVPSDHVPYSFTAPRHPSGHPVENYTINDHRWTFQGNDLAFVSVLVHTIDLTNPEHAAAIIDQANRTYGVNEPIDHPQDALAVLINRR